MKHIPTSYWQKPLNRVFFLLLAVALTITSSLSVYTVAEAANETAETIPGKLAVVGSKDARLYDQPDGEIVRSLPAGSSLTAVARSQDGKWILVIGGGDDPLWVARAELVLFGSESLPVEGAQQTTASKAQDESHKTVNAQPITAQVKAMKERLNVRNGPGIAYNIIDKVQAGQVLTIVEQDAGGEWVQIIIPNSGQRGWASSRYLEINTKL